MKKTIPLLVMAFCILFLSACGRADVSDKALSCGEKALGIADAYLNKNIDASTAREKLDELHEEMKYVDEMSHDNRYKAGDFSVSVCILSLSNSILIDGYEGDNETYENVKEDRDNLADTLGR